MAKVNTIRIKRSSVPGKAPAVSDLSLGELALNTFDGKLYTLRDNGTPAVAELSWGGVPDFSSQTGAVALASGTTSQRPASPVMGMIRYNSTLDVIEAYIGSTWAAIIGNVDFGMLSSATVDDHGPLTAAVTESSDYGALN